MLHVLQGMREVLVVFVRPLYDPSENGADRALHSPSRPRLVVWGLATRSPGSQAGLTCRGMTLASFADCLFPTSGFGRTLVPTASDSLSNAPGKIPASAESDSLSAATAVGLGPGKNEDVIRGTSRIRTPSRRSVVVHHVR